MPTKQRKSVISVSYRDKNALYISYMPYIKGGGLFIPTKKQYTLGDELFLLVSIIDDPEKHTIASKVVLITPSTSNKKQGIGVQLVGKNKEDIKQLIESKLGSAINSDRSTYTM